MKKYLLIISFITLFSCSQEEVSIKKMSSNQANFTIKSDTQYAVMVAYLTKDKWGQETPYLVEKIVTGDTAFTVGINKEQNFAYFIQMKDKGFVNVTFQFKEKNITENYVNAKGIPHSIYEFYPQTF